jgi:signal recognition particle GTPase
MIVCYDPFRAATADQLTVYFYRGPNRNKTSKYIKNGEIKSTPPCVVEASIVLFEAPHK